VKSNYAKYGERSKVGTSRAVRNGFQREGQRVRLFRVVPERVKVELIEGVTSRSVCLHDQR
jgi:hypothetical protein